MPPLQAADFHTAARPCCADTYLFGEVSHPVPCLQTRAVPFFPLHDVPPFHRIAASSGAIGMGVIRCSGYNCIVSHCSAAPQVPRQPVGPMLPGPERRCVPQFIKLIQHREQAAIHV